MLIDLIEDDPFMGEALTERLRIEGLECRWWQTATEAMQAAASGIQPPSAIVSDVRLPDMEGPELRDAMPPVWRQIPWIFITGYGTQVQRNELIARGALDFFTKPLDMDRLMQRLHNLAPRPEPAGEKAPIDPACPLGISGEMRRLHRLVERLGTHWDTVLITGESGSGKEELARCLHKETLGEAAPFVAVNANALPEALIEAELFGHEKGAFTGAGRMRRGVFEQAHGGTLFLDEIGDMPLSLQGRLLRVLQDRTITRLGSEKSQQVQVRLIFATHKKLNEEVRAGRFREDLYYRINVVHLWVPPLRDRPEDVNWLAQRFVDRWNQAHPTARRRLTSDAEWLLTRRNWPGNVRELRNCIERACLLSDGDTLDPALLRADEEGPLDISRTSSPVAAQEAPMPHLETFLRSQERAYIQQALAHHDWQIGVTAEALGISRKNLWERMKRLSIQ